MWRLSQKKYSAVKVCYLINVPAVQEYRKTTGMVPSKVFALGNSTQTFSVIIFIPCPKHEQWIKFRKNIFGLEAT